LGATNVFELDAENVQAQIKYFEKRRRNMALKIRLTRLGDKGNPFYRVIVADSKSPRDGKFVEQIGTFDPQDANDKTAVKIEKEKALAWISKGATPTDTARVVLEKAGVLEKKKPVIKKEAKPKPVKSESKKEK